MPPVYFVFVRCRNRGGHENTRDGVTCSADLAERVDGAASGVVWRMRSQIGLSVKGTSYFLPLYVVHQNRQCSWSQM